MGSFCEIDEGNPTPTIVVIGAGTMGGGISLTAAMSGFNVIQIDTNDDQLQKCSLYHKKTTLRSVEKKRITSEQSDIILKKIQYKKTIESHPNSCCVIEAATENFSIKKEIFKKMFDCFPKETILATNTSSISIKKISEIKNVPSGRVIGMHFFNPVPVMKLCEVIKSEHTTKETLDQTITLAKKLGKTPVLANDFPGFVSNRVLMPMINEAFLAWEQGVSGPEEIDEIMKLGCAFPMGPLRLADLIGLDVCRDIMMVLHSGLGHRDKYKPNKKLLELVDLGHFGQKSGRGVYDYNTI